MVRVNVVIAEYNGVVVDICHAEYNGVVDICDAEYNGVVFKHLDMGGVEGDTYMV